MLTSNELQEIKTTVSYQRVLRSTGDRKWFEMAVIVRMNGELFEPKLKTFKRYWHKPSGEIIERHAKSLSNTQIDNCFTIEYKIHGENGYVQMVAYIENDKRSLAPFSGRIPQ